VSRCEWLPCVQQFGSSCRIPDFALADDTKGETGQSLLGYLRLCARQKL